MLILEDSLPYWLTHPRCLAQEKLAFTAGNTQAATAALNANIALFNPVVNATVVVVFGIVISVSAAMSVSIFQLTVDPALTAATAPANMRLGGTAAVSKFESQSLARPAVGADLSDFQLAVGVPVQACPEEWIVIPGGQGILISSALVVGNMSVAIQFAESNF